MNRPGNQMGAFKVLLYQLKRYYGATADLYYEAADSVDLSTGRRTVDRQKWRVRRAICLPTETSAQMMLPAAVKMLWKQGGGAEAGDKQIVVDRGDLPKGLKVATHNWSAVIDGRRYEVLSVEEFESEIAYLITLKELAGAPVDEYVAASFRDSVEVAPGP